MDRMEIKMCGNIVVFLVICRMLHWTEIIDFKAARYNNHAAWVLAGSTLNAGAALC